MRLIKFDSQSHHQLIDAISEIFDISDKECFSFGIDYQKIDPILQEKFLDDGDFHPEWLNFLINLVTQIIKSNDNHRNIILQREKSLKNKLKNIKFNTITLRLDDFIEISLKCIAYDLGFFIVWDEENNNLNKISKFSGLLTPVGDGQAMICIANKEDNILKYIEKIINNQL